jgi:hypothetical protein
MRAGIGARSVASMRLSFPSLAAAVTGTAAALAVAAPAQGADAIFGGTAMSGAPIVLKADAEAQRLRSLTLSWYADCSDGGFFDGGGELTAAEPIPGFSAGPRELLASRNAKGRFEGEQSYSTESDTKAAVVQVKAAGKLTSKRARGTLSAVVKVSDKATGAEVTSCQTSGSWTATRSPGTIFGGTTSQDQPIVLRRNKAEVGDVITSWVAPCAGDAGYFSSAAHWVSFPLQRTGRFGDAFDDDAVDADGAKIHWDFAVSGRLRASANGTLRIKVTRTDPAGAVADCDSGKVTWKATTG